MSLGDLMTTDLWMLVAAAGLQFVLILHAAIPRFVIKGIPWALGNRDEKGAEMPAWADRFQRSSDNLRENLLLFAVLVLVAHVSGKASATTGLGAQVFVGARVVHAVLYAVGVPYLRTAAWGVAVAGMGMIAWALL